MRSGKKPRQCRIRRGSVGGQCRAITQEQLEIVVRKMVQQAGFEQRPTVSMWTTAEERNAAARDHAYVYPDTLEFHFSTKTLSLDDSHRHALVAHEIGHCLAQHHWGSSTEDEADAAAKQWLGTKICYDHAWPGKGLQVVCSRARAANPGVTPSDLDDAIEYAHESFDAPLDHESIQVSDVHTIAVDDLYNYDDVDAWAQWSKGELADLEPDERYADLESFRGKDFAARATRWIDSGSVPPIVLLDLEEGAAVGDGRGRVSVVLGMGWPSVDAVVVTRRITNPSPNFTTYEESIAWIAAGTKRYGGKNNFLASDEYRQAVPELQALYQAYRAGYANSKRSQLGQASIVSGDRVSRFAPGTFGAGEEIHGTIVMRKGEPWVKFDEKAAVSVDGRVSMRSTVRWSPAWRKLERNPSDLVAPSSSTPSQSGYLYHATNEDNLDEIVASGKLITHGPSHGTDQSEWPDGSRQKRSYWSPRASSVWQFAPEHGRAVILRTPRGADFKDERGTGDVYTTKPVAANQLEVLTTDGWRPLVEIQSNPSPIHRGTPPQDLSDYLKTSEIEARYRSVYFTGDTKIASSRTTPAPTSIPIGTWRYDDGFKGVYGHEIDELVEIDPHEIDPKEFSWDHVREDLRRSGKLEDAERYAQWLAAGNEMPPVTVVQTDRDTLRLSDGHRRTYAAVIAGKPVRAWISWNAPHPKGLIDSNGWPMKVGLTYEIATGRQPNPRQIRIGRRITDA